MRKLSQTQTATGTWAADTTIRVEIENDGLITQIDGTVEVTPSATLTGANQPHGNWRVGRNFQVQGGSHTYFALPDDDGAMGGALLHYMNQEDFRGMAGVTSGAILAPQRTFTPVTFVLHAGARPLDENGEENVFDLSGFVPGLNQSTITLLWTVSGNDVMDDTVTITSAVLRITRHFVLGTHEEVMREMQAQHVMLPTPESMGLASPITGMLPAWSVAVDSPAATVADYGRILTIPTDGSYLKRIAILAQDATATRTLPAGDEVTGIKVSIHGQEIFKCFVEALTNKLKYASNITANAGASEAATTEKFGADFNAHAMHGIYLVPLNRHTEKNTPGALYGVNLAKVPSSAAVLGLTLTTNAAGDDSLILYERYKAYHGKVGF